MNRSDGKIGCDNGLNIPYLQLYGVEAQPPSIGILSMLLAGLCGPLNLRWTQVVQGVQGEDFKGRMHGEGPGPDTGAGSGRPLVLMMNGVYCGCRGVGEASE